MREHQNKELQEAVNCNISLPKTECHMARTDG